jgi:diguanylate cyclase (GGDEF)-like protein
VSLSPIKHELKAFLGAISHMVALLLVLTLWTVPALAADDLEKITMQLRWKHQFQFAGYYAAKHKGFYREKGLDVTLVAGAPGRTPVNEVLEGRAEYGEANSEVLYGYLNGQPLVALAAIFQHSPSVLLTLKNSGIQFPHNLVGKKVMMVGGTDDFDFLAMLVNEGVDPDSLQIIPSSYNIQDLIDGKVDVFNAYLTNEPFYLKEQGLEGRVISPINYGVDFYSDILFTSREEIKKHPKRVKAFREASIRGWEYAMAHPEEIIDLIVAEYGSEKSRAHLQFEADAMQKLILPDLVPVGNINPGRFHRMADLMVRFGFAEPGFSLDDFIYNPDPTVGRGLFIGTVAVIGGLLILAILVVGLLMRFNRRFRQEIHQRRVAEQELVKIAFHDALTGLPNRNLFSDRLERSMEQVKRSKLMLAVVYLDLDGFKQINDSHGHQIGDRYLVGLATALQQELRGVDTISRFGGDEFLAIFNDLKNRNEVDPLLQRLLKIASQTVTIDGVALSCSASIGVTFYPQDEEVDADLLIRQADIAMYQAKTSGKNCYRFFEQAS